MLLSKPSRQYQMSVNVSPYITFTLYYPPTFDLICFNTGNPLFLRKTVHPQSLLHMSTNTFHGVLAAHVQVDLPRGGSNVTLLNIKLISLFLLPFIIPGFQPSGL